MKKLLISLSAILTLVGCTSAGIEETGIKISNLESSIIESQKTSAALKDEVVVLKNETMTLERNVDILNIKVEAIKKSLSE